MGRGICVQFHKPQQETGQMPHPLVGGHVHPGQCCPAFKAREGALPGERECWFCAYADFHLERTCTEESGTCKYPKTAKKTRIVSRLKG